MVMVREGDHFGGKLCGIPGSVEIFGLPAEFWELLFAIGDDEGGRAGGDVMLRTVSSHVFGRKPQLLVEIAQADGVQIEDPTYRSAAADSTLVESHCNKMPASRVARHVKQSVFRNDMIEVCIQAVYCLPDFLNDPADGLLRG